MEAATNCKTGFGAFFTSSIAQIYVCNPAIHIFGATLVANSVLVAVQNYITAILVFLVVEMLMTWGFYG